MSAQVKKLKNGTSARGYLLKFLQQLLQFALSSYDALVVTDHVRNQYKCRMMRTIFSYFRNVQCFYTKKSYNEAFNAAYIKKTLAPLMI